MAAFINAIAEEGTKDEAVKWLQKTWDELMEVKVENAKLREALEPFVTSAAHTRVFLTTRELMHPTGVSQYDEAIERARAALTPDHMEGK